MRPKRIKAELKKRGYTLTMVAESIGRSPSLLSKVVSGEATSLEAARAVAKAIDKPLEEVFPGNYRTAGHRGYKKTEEYQRKLAELRQLLRRD